jgi:16S rRNA processing protein RimM
VRVHWSGSQTLQSVDSVIVRQVGEPDRILGVRTARPVHGAFLVHLQGIDDLTQAEKLRGAGLHVERERLPPLAPGEYYLADLVGANVWAGDREVGKVIDIRIHPTVDSIVIQNEQGTLMEQALLDCWLEEVDVAQGRIRLTTTDGLIE